MNKPASKQHGPEHHTLETELSLYPALPTPTSIRVLHVRLKNGTDGPIHCYVKVVDLNDQPDYIALSYTWGSPTNDPTYSRPEQVYLHHTDDVSDKSHPIRITKNCHTFLQEYRSIVMRLWVAAKQGHGFPEAVKMGLIWIDAICINQTSLEEKSAQVRMMDRIYKQARKVVIWLGPSDETTRPAIKAIYNLSEVDLDKCTKVHGRSIKSAEVYGELGIPVISEQEWIAVSRIYERAWFKRAWTVQEFVLAKTDNTLCGGMMISFGAIVDAARVMMLIGWDMEVAMFPGFETPGSSSMEPNLDIGSLTIDATNARVKSRPPTRDFFTYPAIRLQYLRDIRDQPWAQNSTKEAWEKNGSTFPFQAVLYATSHRVSTDPRDRIYACFGLASMAALDGIPIDYSLPADQLYVLATRALMSTTRSLSMLSYVTENSYKQMSDLPSWVPDYTAFQGRMSLDWGGNANINCIPGLRMAFFNVSAGLPYTLGGPVGNGKRRLHVKGLCYDRIDRLATFDPYELQALEPILDAITAHPPDWLWRTLLGDEHVLGGIIDDDSSRQPAQASDGKIFYYYLLDNIVDLFEKALTEKTQSGCCSNRERDEPFQHAVRELSAYKKLVHEPFSYTAGRTQFAWYNWRKSSLRWMPGPESLETGYKVVGVGRHRDDIVENSVLVKFMKSLDARTFRNLLFSTRSRKYGLGISSAIEKGDEVWVLAGAKVPYILRPAGDGTYALVGEAYVHGIMHGEFVQGKEGHFREVILV